MKAEKTKVIFRKYGPKDGGAVLALFPREVGTNDYETCLSYEHCGQHGSADLQHCTNAFRLATPDEYKDLAQELQRIGYILDIRKRSGYADFLARRAQLRNY